MLDSFSKRFALHVFSDVLCICVQITMHVQEMIFPRLELLCDASASHPWHAAGFGFILSAILGDLKWMNTHYSIHNFRSNFPCSLCRACKIADSVGETICDFRPTAAHLRTSISHESFIASLNPQDVPLPCRYGLRCLAAVLRKISDYVFRMLLYVSICY